MTKSRAHADSRSKAGGRTDAESDGKPEPSGAVALVEQAEAVKASLKQALAKTGELISSLKRQHKQSKSVQAALASLRQLENVGA